MAIFALLFIVLPLLEIYVAVQVGHAIGALGTVGLLLLLSLSGVWLTKLAGLGVISRIRTQLQAGQMPTNELIDGGIVLAGGVLLVVPGFVTAVVGLFLLFPPTRVLTRSALKRRFHNRVGHIEGAPGRYHLDGGPDDIIDL